jgi:hypothetical protein
MQWGTASVLGSIAVAAGAPMAAQAEGPRSNRGKLTVDVDKRTCGDSALAALDRKQAAIHVACRRLASTRAASAPGSLASGLVSSWPSVRSHVVESVRLPLRLMAGGSILTRAPAP